MYDTIFLLGYMASGKTTLGKQLAFELNKTFIDLDKLIEKEANKSINRIFEEEGETAFRQMEKNMLTEIASSKNSVIALGGGSPCFENNMDLINQSGLSIYLKQSASVIQQRLINKKSMRPLLKNMDEFEMLEFIQQHIGEREYYYLKADLIFVGDNVFELVSAINNYRRN